MLRRYEMNESQVEEVMARFRKEIPVRQPKRQPRKVLWRPALVAAGLTVIVISIIPRDAHAAKIERMRKAMRAATTYEIVGSTRTERTDWVEKNRIICDGKRMRQEARRGTTMAFTTVTDGRRTLTDYQVLPFATMQTNDQEDIEPTDEDQAQSLLREALYIIDGGNSPVEYSLNMEKGEPIGGRTTYVILAARKDFDQTQRVVVDETTNLPIESITKNITNGYVTYSKSEYRYGKKFDQELFSLDSQKPIIDTKKGRAELMRRWNGGDSNTLIQSCTIHPDGSIWIAYVGPDWPQNSFIPVKVSIPGLDYRMASTFNASQWSVSKDLRISGKSLWISVLVPIHGSARPDARIELTFANQNPRTRRTDGPVTTESALLVRDTSPMPMYLVPIGAQRTFIDRKPLLWQVKGEAREARGNLFRACEAYQNQAECMAAMGSSMAYRPYRKAAEIARKLNDISRAWALEAQAAKYEKLRGR